MQHQLAKLKQHPKILRAALMVAMLLAGVITLSFAVTNSARLAETLAQLNFNYEIEAPDSVNFDCNMHFDEDKHAFLCDSRNYFGRVSMNNRSSLSIGGEWHKTDENGNFERYVPALAIPASSWAVADPDFDQILDKVNYYYDMIVIRNNYLWSGMKQKDVVVTWNFSNDDRKLMEETWQKWSQEQKQKAKERLEAEEKAAEEARLKAEQEAREKAEQEAREKAAAAAKAAEEAKQKTTSNSGASSSSNSSSSSSSSNSSSPSSSSSSSSSNSSSSSSSNSGSSSSSGGGYSADETDIDGYCKDGLKVHGNPHARGKANVCYGHKGWEKN